MKRICRELQERLALEGAGVLREDAAAQRHVEECDLCFGALEGMAALDEALVAMKALAADAPESAVAGLMERVAAGVPAEGKGDESPAGERGIVRTLWAWPTSRRPGLWGLSAAASVTVVAVLLTWPSFYRARVATGDRRIESGAVGRDAAGTEAGEWSAERVEALRALGYVGDTGHLNKDKEAVSVETRAVLPGDKPEANEVAQAMPGRQPPVREQAEPFSRDAQSASIGRNDVVLAEEGLDAGMKDDGHAGVAGGVMGGPDGLPGEVVGGAVGGEVDGPVRVDGAIRAPKLLRRVEPVYPPEALQARVQGTVALEVVLTREGRPRDVRVVKGHPMLDRAAVTAVTQWVYAPTLRDGRPVEVVLTVTVPFQLRDASKPSSSHAPIDDRARAFLEERAAVEGLTFQEASGYWRNTYLPGDSRTRLLQASLASWDASRLAAPPHEMAAPPQRPFDAPRNAGLALSLYADRKSLDGPQRILVQVGLKGAPRVGGARPAMNVGLVLDLRGDVPTDVGAAMRALMTAFSEARQTGDRFHLVVAGRAGGLLVRPEEFKHGPLTVALDRQLAGQAAGDDVDLPAAVAAAFGAVCGGGENDEPFGTSAVVLVTGQAMGAATGTLTDLAHQGAVAGIPLTTIGVGAQPPAQELERLALAGQGRRRLMPARDDARRMVDEELHAASSAVARAVRLRIRLAAGVRLVDVLGSARLDERQAESVREAERSLDLRLARHLGIEADRGQDEDGIQIVIPAFHASDAHVILLDVVAPGPGDVADVSVRYKDVAFRRNGVARASLTLPAGAHAAGPLERQVLKSLLAFRLSTALEQAADASAAGNVATAAVWVDDARALLAALRSQLPGLGADPDIARDLQMLDGYSRLLADQALAEAQRARIADSLRYAGRLKLLRRQA